MPKHKRPCCMYCGNHLSTRTYRIQQVERPKIGDLVPHPWDAKQKVVVKAVVRFDRMFARPGWVVWCGEYNGYGATDTGTIFCKLDCSLRFALAAFRKGFRMVRKTK